MADKAVERKAYSKPEIRKIKLSLAELTLGTNCNVNAPSIETVGGCPPAAAVCNA